MLQIGYHSPWEVFGGVELYVLWLARELSTNQIDVDVLTADNSPRTVSRKEGRQIVLKVPFLKWKMLFSVSKLIYGLRVIQYIKRNYTQYDIFHFHGDNGIVSNLVADKSVLTLHGISRNRGSFLSFLLTYVTGLIESNNCRRARVVLSVSSEAAKTLSENTAREIITIGLGVDTEKYKMVGMERKEELRKELNLEKESAYGIIVGRDPFRKGLATAADAVEIIKDIRVRLLAIGFPGYVSETDSDSLTLLGDLDDDMKIKYLQSSDFFILPSKKEGFPMACLEAVAVGLPLVVSSSSQSSELRDYASSYFEVDSNDPKDYANAIQSTLNKTEKNPSSVTRQRYLQFKQQFSREATFEKCMKAYSQILGQRIVN